MTFSSISLVSKLGVLNHILCSSVSVGFLAGAEAFGMTRVGAGTSSRFSIWDDILNCWGAWKVSKLKLQLVEKFNVCCEVEVEVGVRVGRHVVLQ